MTFTNFLQVLAFNLLSNTIPLCILLYVTAYLIVRMYEKRIIKHYNNLLDASVAGIVKSNKRKAGVDED